MRDQTHSGTTAICTRLRDLFTRFHGAKDVTRGESLRDFIRRTGHATTEATLNRYVEWIHVFTGWNQGKPITPQRLQAFHDYLLKERGYNPNYVRCIKYSTDYYLAWCGARDPTSGELLKMKLPERIPAKKVRTATDEDRATLRKMPWTLEERTGLGILMDTGMRPGDVTSLRPDNLDLSKDLGRIRRTATKNAAAVNAALSPETTADLKAYIASRPLQEWLFPSARGGHRARTWLRQCLDRSGILGLAPRSFRRYVATRIKDIQAAKLQGGWKSAQTIEDVYRSVDESTQEAEFRRAFGLSEETDEPAGYL